MVVDDAEQRTSGLDDDAERVRNFALRDFRRSGVDRDEATRDRVREINERETELGQTFERHIRDDGTTVKVRPEQLAGLPGRLGRGPPRRRRRPRRAVAGVPRRRPDADLRHRPRGPRHRRDGVQQPGLAGQRRRPGRADEPPPGARRTPRVRRVAGLRRRGQDDRDRRRDRGVHREDQQGGRGLARSATATSSSTRIRQDRPDAEALDGADTRFYIEAIKREQHSVDAQEVRRYFAFEKVRQGLLDVTGRLFDLGYVQVDAPSWHPDVDVVRRHPGRPADRPDPPRPPPAGQQVQPRRAVHPHRRRHRAAAARGRAGVQLPRRG